VSFITGKITKTFTILYLTTTSSLHLHYNKKQKQKQKTKKHELIDGYKYTINKSTKEKKTVKYIDS